jgi:hypothetical protein
MLDRIDLLTGQDFQRFCSVLLSSDDSMFAAVDGSGGDMGNDGFRLAGDTLYQAYGPTKRVAAKVRSKIDASVAQAAALRKSASPVRRLVFLTPFDLTHEQHLYLQQAAVGAGLASEPWGGSRLASILSRHPEIRQLFPQFLLPDVAGDVQAIRAAVEAVPRGPKTVDDVFGEDFEPNLSVLQWNEEDPARDLQAYEYFRVRVYSPAFRRGPFEPDEEDAFRDAVRATFEEDRTAELEPTGPGSVLVEHRHPRLMFHRRWGWWGKMSKPGGAVGMAATLRDLGRDGIYSAADVAADLVRFLTLAGSLAAR